MGKIQAEQSANSSDAAAPLIKRYPDQMYDQTSEPVKIVRKLLLEESNQQLECEDKTSLKKKVPSNESEEEEENGQEDLVAKLAELLKPTSDEGKENISLEKSEEAENQKSSSDQNSAKQEVLSKDEVLLKLKGEELKNGEPSCDKSTNSNSDKEDEDHEEEEEDNPVEATRLEQFDD